MRIGEVMAGYQKQSENRRQFRKGTRRSEAVLGGYLQRLDSVDLSSEGLQLREREREMDIVRSYLAFPFGEADCRRLENVRRIAGKPYNCNEAIERLLEEDEYPWI